MKFAQESLLLFVCFGFGFVGLFDNGCLVAVICNYLFYNLLFCFLLSSFNLYEFILLTRCLMSTCFYAGVGGVARVMGNDNVGCCRFAVYIKLQLVFCILV